jgi:hypothetical protein
LILLGRTSENLSFHTVCRCTRRATAGCARFRTRVNLNVMFHHVVDNLIGRHRRNRIASGAACVFGDDSTGSHPHIFEGLFPGFCQVTPYGQPPILPTHRLAVCGGRLFSNRPLLLQAGAADHVSRHAQRDRRGAVLACQQHSSGGLHRRHRDRKGWLLGGPGLERSVPQLQPVGVARDRLAAVQELHHHTQQLVHHLPLPFWMNTKHIRVGGQSPGPSPA